MLANRQDEAWIRSRSPTPKLQTAWIHFPLQGRQGFFEFHLTYFRQIPRLYSSLVPFTSWVMFCHISDMISFCLVERKILYRSILRICKTKENQTYISFIYTQPKKRSSMMFLGTNGHIFYPWVISFRDGAVCNEICIFRR